MFIPISKVDEARRLVYGIATAEVPDKSDEIFDYASSKPFYQEWSDSISIATGGKSLGNVREMHSSIAAGKLTQIEFDDEAKQIEVCAKVVDDATWNKVVEGVLTGFSQGGSYERRWTDPNNPKLKRYTAKPSEISLVDNPCVPTATFEYIKADGSREMRKFITPSNEDSMTTADKGGAAAADNTQPAADSGATVSLNDDGVVGKSTADAVPQLVKDGKAVKPKTAPVQKWLANDGAAYDSKREAEVHNLELEKKAELAPGLAQMEVLLKAAKKPVDEDEDEEGDDEDTKKAKKVRRDEKAAKAKEKAEKDDAEMAAKAKEKEDAEKAAEAADLGKKDYSDKERKEMADKKEALPDGSFPIKTKKDLENAIQAFGRAKDKDEAKAHIKARAKALDAEDMLPEEWSSKKKEKAAPTGVLQKGMYSVGELACILERIQWLINSSKFEEAMEGDDSDMPKKLMAWLKDGVPLLQAMVAEETSEMVDDDEDDVMEMAANWKGDECAALAKCARSLAEPLVKSDSKKEAITGAGLLKLAEVLEKAGARHSKVDARRVQALQDHADEVHKCMGDMAEKCMDMHKAAGKAKNTAIALGAKGEPVDDEDDAEPASKSAMKMSKALAELNAKNDEVLVVTKLATTQNETLLKAIPLIEGLQAQVKTLTEEKSEIAKRVEHLEKQPAAPKGHVRAISKAQDSGETGDGKAEAERTARMAKMTPAERSRELMKLAMSNPIESPNL